jgi:hypothetical protein
VTDKGRADRLQRGAFCHEAELAQAKSVTGKLPWRPRERSDSGRSGSAGRKVGGFRKDESVKAGCPLVVLYPKNLDATLAAVRAAGGRVVKEPFAFPGGRAFTLQTHLEMSSRFGRRLDCTHAVKMRN